MKQDLLMSQNQRHLQLQATLIVVKALHYFIFLNNAISISVTGLRLRVTLYITTRDPYKSDMKSEYCITHIWSPIMVSLLIHSRVMMRMMHIHSLQVWSILLLLLPDQSWAYGPLPQM